MTHSKLQNPEFVGESYDELLSSRAEAIRRELDTPAVVVKSKKISLMRGLIFPVAIILIWLAVTQYRFFNPQPGQTVFELGKAEILGPSDLCPGDSLRFIIGVDVLEQGIYSLAMSTWKVSPPATVVFSEGLDMVIADSREFPIAIEWVVPETYINPYNGNPTEWIPGSFTRDVAVSAVGRNTAPSIVAIPFTIKEGCPPLVSRRTLHSGQNAQNSR